MAPIKVCSLDGCSKPHQARGWCRKHYHRWRSTGDPLKTKSTPWGEAKHYLQEIVIPYQGNDCLTWPYGRCQSYGQTRVHGKTAFAHRVVCEAVYGPPPTPEHHAAHSCGKGSSGCVNPNHLRWATVVENHADKLEHGTHNRGERHPLAKLTESNVHEIRSLRGKATQVELGLRYGVARSIISRIQTGKRWSWLE